MKHIVARFPENFYFFFLTSNETKDFWIYLFCDYTVVINLVCLSVYKY